MTTETRESQLSAAFVKLADSLVTGYDAVDLLHWLVETCTDVLDVDAATLMIADPTGALRLMASTSAEATRLETLQLALGEGPAVDTFLTGNVITVGDLENELTRWPRFATEALKLGFRSSHAAPMRLRDQRIGALNLFGHARGDLGSEDVGIAQAWADVATIGIQQERSIRDARLTSDQLQRALHSRTLIEQAKGVLATTLSTTVDNAFEIMRAHARANNLLLRDIADDIIASRLQLRKPRGA